MYSICPKFLMILHIARHSWKSCHFVPLRSPGETTTYELESGACLTTPWTAPTWFLTGSIHGNPRDVFNPRRRNLALALLARTPVPPAKRFPRTGDRRATSSPLVTMGPAPDSQTVGYAADRERTVAQSHIRMGAGDEERTVGRLGCPCEDDCSGSGRGGW